MIPHYAILLIITKPLAIAFICEHSRNQDVNNHVSRASRYFVPQVQLLLDCMSLDERTQLLFSLFLLQVTGGANFDLEMSLAEGAGLRGGYSTHHSLAARSPSPASPSPLGVIHTLRNHFWGCRYS